MSQLTASAVSASKPGSVLRYGNPAIDCDGAWIRPLSRQLATVVTVGGEVSVDNIEQIAAFVNRFIPDEKPFVLDLSAVDSIAAQPDRLLDAVSEACGDAGVEWAMVAGDAVRSAMGAAEAAWPTMASVPDALEYFAEVNLRRRTMLLPLLATKLIKSA